MASKGAGGSGEEISKDGVKNDTSEISIMISTNFGPIKRKGNRNKKVECKICLKTMQANHLSRHMKQHPKFQFMSEDEARQELRSRKQLYEEREKAHLKIELMAQEMKVPLECIEEDAKREGLTTLPSIDDEVLDRELLNGMKEYNKKLARGKGVYEKLGKGEVVVESLSKRNREALESYRKQKPNRDYSDIVLRPWQEEALKLINPPSERDVIWITGKNGNEGKTWFQGYIQSLYGISRAVRLDLRIKHGNICNVLQKRSLATIDIFLFNDARSNAGTIDVVYKMLEDLKDGIATGVKYNNDILTFRTPNTVMVF